jgi:signal transduction histidine kinase
VRAVARLPERVEVAAYYVVSEALTNAAKHAQASLVNVEVETVEGALRLCVRDDGVGGADPIRGSGLVGLKDRVEALGGAITIQSPRGRAQPCASSSHSAADGGAFASRCAWAAAPRRSEPVAREYRAAVLGQA